MYFMVENTPESVKRQQRAQLSKPEPTEERPCLSLAPFSRPPLVLFENVPIGATSERSLDVINPTKKTIQLSMGRAPPPGLVVCLPEMQVELAPQQAYSLTLRWTPHQPTSQRDTIHFTDQYRGRYEVIVVLKTIIIKPVKKLKSRKSPKRIGGCSPKKFGVCSSNLSESKQIRKVSPKLLTQKRNVSSYHATNIQNYVKESLYFNKKPQMTYTNKENFSPEQRPSTSSQKGKFCPFESLTSLDSADSFNFNITTSDIFNMRGRDNQTYSDNFSGIQKLDNNLLSPKTQNKIPHGVLSPSTRHNIDVGCAIDDLTFTPLKSVPVVKVTRPAQRECKENYENEYYDRIENDKKTVGETHSIIMIKSHDENDFNTNFLQSCHTNEHPVDFSFSIESSTHSKKIPNTSSPKQLSSPVMNFTMNAEFSHITDTTFYPQRCSTERKLPSKNSYHGGNILKTPDEIEKHYYNISYDTFVKPDCPQMSLDADEHKPVNLPYQNNQAVSKSSVQYARQLDFNERVPSKLSSRQYRNCGDGVKGIIEANLWRDENAHPPRSITPPPLQSIPEESTQYSVSHVDRTNNAFNTFTIDRTFDKPRESFSKPRESITSWQKKSVRCDPALWKKPTRIKETFKVTENFNDIVTDSALHHIADVYTQASTVDPFLSSTYFYDEEAVDKFEKDFKRWLNCILTPPVELESNLDETKIDVGKIWTENKNKEIPVAPTREQVSSRYHTNHRLESVRKSARTLMLSTNVVEVFKKLNAQVDKKLITMRPDKNLPMDVGLQKIITELLLCYNPLWLRIGLETLYGTVIPLNSNSDIFGLTTFIIQRFFKDPYAKNKHSHPTVPNMLLPSYIEYMRKFTVKKFFMLVFFLDQAKQKKLILHDPCLFCRHAQYKESRDLLIQFTKELIAGIGDITRHLRPLGYVVSHKQSYLDEYKYAVHNLALDLKDGIRLTRVMEIILVKPGLMTNMRTPPVSRLQKIHNVQVALNSLKDANFNIVGDITAKDIADGHREKTLSLLWQIIHVFRAPLFEKASITIQAWWRKKYLGVIIQKRIEQKKLMKKHNAASVIQTWWRRIQYNRLVEKNMKELQAACIVVQSYWRMWSCRHKFLKYKSAVRKIECWYTLVREKKIADEILRQLLLQQRSVARIQLWYRNHMRARRILIIRDVYLQYMECCKMRRRAAVVIQTRYRAKKLMELDRANYSSIRNAVIIIQNHFRAHRSMKLQRMHYLELLSTAITMQRRIRATIKMKICHEEFRQLKNVTVIIQNRFRANKLMKQRRSSYCLQKSAANKIKEWYRASKRMKEQRALYVNLLTAVVQIQHRYRACRSMRKERSQYCQLRKSAILIQQKYRALCLMRLSRLQYCKLKKSAILIQQKYRALHSMRETKEEYRRLKDSAVLIQRKYRALRIMREKRMEYCQLKKSAIIIQQKYKALRSMHLARTQYCILKKSVICIQQKYRALCSMRKTREEYCKMKNSAILIQQKYRALRIMREKRLEYCQLKKSTVFIQQTYRAIRSMRSTKVQYIILKKSAILIQQKYRALCSMRKTREEYRSLKKSAILIQQKYKAIRTMRVERMKYCQLQKSTIIIQRKYRALMSMRSARTQYCELKKSAILIQQKYRALRLMRKTKEDYETLKKSALLIQQKYRAIIAMREERKQYCQLQKSVILIQRKYRALSSMRVVRLQYCELKKSAILIQQKYRALRLMRKTKEEYGRLKKSVILVQQKYRALCSMRISRIEYIKLKTSVIAVQRKYRALRSMREKRSQYCQLRKSAIIIQQNYRAIRYMRQARLEYCNLKKYGIFIQQKYRAKKKGIQQRNEYLIMRQSAFKIQTWYRSTHLMKNDKQKFLQLKKKHESAKRIQVWYRSALLMRENKERYLRLRMATIKIQSFYRMYRIQKLFKLKRQCAICIQNKFRSYQMMKIERQNFVNIKFAAIKIQAWWRCQQTRQIYNKFMSSVRTIQITYRRRIRMREIKLKIQKRDEAAICIQKYVRRYFCMKSYQLYRQKVVFIQKSWRNKLFARKAHQTSVIKMNTIVKVQSLVRGYLARLRVKQQRQTLAAQKEENRKHLAASKIQALFRGNRVREQMKHRPAVAEIRQKLIRNEPAQKEDTMQSQNEFALDVLTHYRDIPSIIRAFVIIEYLTEVYPMIYHKTCNRVASSLLNYMMMTNRSVSTLDTVRPAAAILVNMARYKHTALIIYSREKIANVIKLIMRWSGQDSKYYCALCTFLWLFGKYPHIKKDITLFLQEPENRNIMSLIRTGVLRKQRMKDNATRHKTFTPRPVKTTVRKSHAMNTTCRGDYAATAATAQSAIVLPALEPDYGFQRADKPRYFENDLDAVDSLFTMYGVPFK